MQLRLNRHVGVSGRGARLTALLLGYPILQSLLAQPEGQTSTPAKGYVILLPVADAVGGFLFHGRKTVPRLLHPRLFMQQSHFYRANSCANSWKNVLKH